MSERVRDPVMELVVMLERRVLDLEARVRELERAPAPPARPVNEAEHRASERESIIETLNACGWNRLQAAKQLGIPRRTFYRRLAEYGIQHQSSTTVRTRRRPRG